MHEFMHACQDSVGDRGHIGDACECVDLGYKVGDGTLSVDGTRSLGRNSRGGKGEEYTRRKGTLD